MALEHAILVSLRERAASGSELTRRFDRSFGFFWAATHQQIYRTLGRMESDGWVTSAVVPQQGKPDTKVYDVSELGAKTLAEWLVTPGAHQTPRSDLGVKLRGAAYADDREAILDLVRHEIAEHEGRLAIYLAACAHDYPDPAALTDADLDRYLVLRGGIRLETGQIEWLNEYLTAWDSRRAASPEETPKEPS